MIAEEIVNILERSSCKSDFLITPLHELLQMEINEWKFLISSFLNL